MKVDSIESEEGPALGGAMLAMVGCGVYSDVEAAAKVIVRVTDTIKPDEKLVETYNKKYQKFSKIYPSLKELFKELAKGE